jgi:hypothetical protein
MAVDREFITEAIFDNLQSWRHSSFVIRVAPLLLLFLTVSDGF